MSCDCHIKIGGPAHTQEVCKSCGAKWTRYRGGSWDWQYKDCISCQSKALIDSLFPKKKKTKKRK